jgi:HSP20 family molecular chaperone IbpA
MKHVSVSAIEKARTPAIVPLLPDDRFLQRTADLRKLIAGRAYELFVEGGFTHGHDLEDWLRAESQLLTNTPMEIFESQEAITIKTALPGWSAQDIEIHVEQQRFSISGQQLEESEHKKGKSIRSEQRWKRIFRSLNLPAQIDPEKVRATFSNGELQVELPKVKAEQKVDATTNAAA